MKRNLLLAFFAAFLMLAGCADPRRDAQIVAREFLAAASSESSFEKEKHLTLAARKAGMGRHISIQSATIGAASVEGEAASVAFNDAKGVPGKVLLRREENRWRVWGVEMHVAELGGRMLTFDLENPAKLGEEMGRQMGEAIAEASKQFKATSYEAGRALGQALKGFHDGLEKGLSETSSPK